MATIFLGQTSGTYQTKGADVTVTVTDEDNYEFCKLFHRHKYKLDPPKEGDIFIFNGIANWVFDTEKCLTLKAENGYEKAKLEFVYVYYNYYEKSTKPLIIVLQYQCNDNVQNRYHIADEINTEIREKHIKNIDKLYPYLGEKEILDVLIKQNQVINQCLTYELEEKNNCSNPILYDGERICLSTKQVLEDPTKRFYTYTHSPTDKYDHYRGFVLYNNDALLSWDSSKMGSYNVISRIQNLKFTSITVYWSTKLDIPLMADFVTNGYKEEHQYFFQTNFKHIVFWKRLYQVNYKELLGETVTDEDEIHRKLSDPSNGKLLKLLDKIEFFLMDTVYVLLDILTSYGEREVEPIIRACDPKLIRSNKITDAQPDPINVKKQECKVLEQFGLCCYMQKFSIHDNYDSGEITLLMPTDTKDKYQELTLFKEEDSTEPDYLFYNNAKGQLYVYYYVGTTSSVPVDRRPLMVCYNGNAYAALDSDGYSSKWYRLKCEKAKYDYMCPEEQFVEPLCKVLGFLNQVKLDERPEDDEMTVKEPNKEGESSQRKAYVLQKYRGENTVINVTYSNLSCYRVYTHKPMDSGHRLGTITYNGSSDTAIGINYDLTRPLTEVQVYYNVYDGGHEYPILVVLVFSKFNRQYFRLKSRDEEKHLTWEELSDHEVDPQNIEQTLYSLRRQMGVVFYDRVRTGTLFDPKACHEHSNKGPIIGVVATLTAVGLCGAFVYYKYPTLIGPLYKRFY